jgi:hypothetical protein
MDGAKMDPEMVYVKRMEDFILRLWVDGEIEDYPIIDEIAKKRQLHSYVKMVRDCHDALVNKLMEDLQDKEPIKVGEKK